jgi:hypothetical protein
MRNKRVLIVLLAAAILAGASSLTRAQGPLPDAAAVWHADPHGRSRRAAAGGKNLSLIFETPCDVGALCGTVMLRGKIKPKDFMKGMAIAVWGTRGDSNVARYQTVNGTFEGFQQ